MEWAVKRRSILWLFLGLLSMGMGGSMTPAVPDQGDERYLPLREKMVQEQIAKPPGFRAPITNEKVLSAMRAVPRHLFVKPSDVSAAYGDHPLPIGFGQTISQPYIVALMTEMLEVEPAHRVLEVGTGSGYQAAILSALVDRVCTVEIVEALGKDAADRLKRLGYENVEVKIGDGYFGWEERAPFDRIIVTCASSLIPPPLLRQLKPGGKMCIPVGGQYAVQHLTIVEKTDQGAITMRKTIPVRFVPLVRS